MTEYEEDRVRSAYGAKYDRLQQIKADVRPGQRLPPQRQHPPGGAANSPDRPASID